jgi:hypothetical protein
VPVLPVPPVPPGQVTPSASLMEPSTLPEQVTLPG